MIENQLERTDHNHLGQLLTYAAGLQVATIVWVTARFTDEHRAALDWLNEITDDSFQFFGLEWMELPDRKSSRLVVHGNNKGPSDRAAWPEYHRWMMEKLEASDRVFRSRVKDLDANAWQPELISGDM